MITFTAWEGIEAGMRGIDLRTFAFTDYGFPDFYQVVLACDRRWLDREPALAKAFVEATVLGFEVAADDPDGAAALLIEENPGVFDANPSCPSQASGSSPSSDYLATRRGRSGTRRSSDGRATRASCTSRACWPGRTASRWPRRPTTRPCSPTTSCHDRRGGPFRRWWPPLLSVGRDRAALGGLRAARGPRPGHAAGPVPRRSARLWDFRETAVGHLVPTLVEALVGCAYPSCSRSRRPIAMDRWEPVRRALYPLLVTSQTIPVVAIAPLLVIWFGFGLLPKVVIVVLVTFFPVIVALLDGVRPRRPEATELLRTMGATDRQAFRLLRWPAALPSLFTGLRIAVAVRGHRGGLRRVRRRVEGPRHLDADQPERLPDRPRLRGDPDDGARVGRAVRRRWGRRAAGRPLAPRAPAGRLLSR